LGCGFFATFKDVQAFFEPQPLSLLPEPQPMTPALTPPTPIAFIGGGNMASALIGGLLKVGTLAQHVHVVEPDALARERLQASFGVQTWKSAGPFLQTCDLVVWAVKPQIFKEAALACATFCAHPLHLSVAAGITTPSICNWLNSHRVVRAMPNTPALVGLGQTGLFATPEVKSTDKKLVEHILSPTGQFLWVKEESMLDAVTALSGSGPAYVFYFIEALCQAGEAMGLEPQAAKQLAIGTFVGASALASQSDESPSTLRERVTSKGGTTFAALEYFRGHQVAQHIQEALFAAQQRAKELGAEFGD
jgi:pyrroline-5-carboxylate reductase